MRFQLFSDVESGAYAQKLLEIGEGHLDTDQEGMVLFTPNLSCCGVGRRTHRSSFSKSATIYSRRKMVV
ncbi:hypothetical protein TNCV_4382711 [Trichonephila clavipes]|nr:hypothetical protein TNCV_4382711 [Trichonephila clavipes]